MKHAKFIVRFAVVAVVLALCVSGFWAVTQNKVVLVNDNPTITYLNFYKLPKNSADVIFLGGSHARDAFIPQELYDNYGITSYNLACSAQPVILSYYWLKEAMRYQRPKVVVLDTFFVFYNNYKAEGDIRKCLDYMRWGKVKKEAVDAVCEKYDGHSKLSYYLTNIRYHDRWKNLDEVNFLLEDIVNSRNFMGYTGGRTGTNKLKFLPLSRKVPKDGDPEVLDSYFEKFADLCAENGIMLLLVKTPHTNQTIERHAAVENFASERGLHFYDMNEDGIYNALGVDFNADFIDYGHANMSGALKITNYIGKLLSGKYGLQPHISEPWVKTRKTYLEAKEDYNLQTIKNASAYLNALKQNIERYTVLIAARGEDFSQLDEASKDALKSLGLRADFSDAAGKCFYAVISGGKVIFEEMAERGAAYPGSLYDGLYVYKMSDGRSITINGKEKAKKQRGLNIVVFNDNLQFMIDSQRFGADAKSNANKSHKNSINPAKFLHARLDVKNEGEPSSDVEVLSISDSSAKVSSPEWLRGNGMGRVIRSDAGSLAFKLKCIADGKLVINLKGEDVRDAEGERIPLWVNYTKLAVDGKVMFDGLKPVWHDRPYKFEMDVADGQIVDVQAEWVPEYAAIGKGVEKAVKTSAEKENEQIKSLMSELSESNAEKSRMSAKLKKVSSSNKKLKRELDRIRSRFWYKVLHRLKLIG